MSSEDTVPASLVPGTDTDVPRAPHHPSGGGERQEVTVRRRQPEDIPWIRPALAEVYDLDGYPVEGVDATMAAIRAEDPLGAWVAEYRGNIVGHVVLRQGTKDIQSARLWEMGTGQMPAVLSRLMVAPSARKQGVGARLVNAVVHDAAALGHRVVLDVLEKDRAAMALYEKLGWHHIGEFTHRSGHQEWEGHAFVGPQMSGPSLSAEDWDRRYSEADMVWSSSANQWVAEWALTHPARLGMRALDIAAGEGRNTLWLAERGWSVDATDFSEAAIERLCHLAQKKFEGDAAIRRRIHAKVADATKPTPFPGGYDLVVMCYLHLPPHARTEALRHAARALGRGGRLLVIGHALRNLTDGVGGPQHAALLYDPEHILADLKTLARPRWNLVSAEWRHRTVPGESREAIDTVVEVARA